MGEVAMKVAGRVAGGCVVLSPSHPDVLALRRPASASWVLREAKQVAPTTRLAGRKSSKSRCAPPVRPLGAPSASGAIGATRLFFFPPELLEPLGPAAVELVEPVPDRVLLVEVLVVLLGGIELRGRHDLGDDQPLERLGLPAPSSIPRRAASASRRGSRWPSDIGAHSHRIAGLAWWDQCCARRPARAWRS